MAEQGLLSPVSLQPTDVSFIHQWINSVLKSLSFFSLTNPPGDNPTSVKPSKVLFKLKAGPITSGCFKSSQPFFVGARGGVA